MFFRKSYVNQPNQGHQPWQSNSLVFNQTTSKPLKTISAPPKATQPQLKWQPKNRSKPSWKLMLMGRIGWFRLFDWGWVVLQWF